MYTVCERIDIISYGAFADEAIFVACSLQGCGTIIRPGAEPTLTPCENSSVVFYVCTYRRYNLGRMTRREMNENIQKHGRQNSHAQLDCSSVCRATQAINAKRLTNQLIGKDYSPRALALAQQ